MAHSRVVILSGHSLFAEGVASRLRQHLHELELEVVDPRQPDAIARITAARPSTVILDANDSEVIEACPLGRLLRALPALKVIRLDSQQQEIQVVTSELRSVSEVRDLIKVIESPV